MKHRVYCQEWIESERGWGLRPDGYSLHLEVADVNAYVDLYWARMPAHTPDEYSYPAGTPTIITVDTETYNKIRESAHGIRVYSLARE